MPDAPCSIPVQRYSSEYSTRTVSDPVLDTSNPYVRAALGGAYNDHYQSRAPVSNPAIRFGLAVPRDQSYPRGLAPSPRLNSSPQPQTIITKPNERAAVIDQKAMTYAFGKQPSNSTHQALVDLGTRFNNRQLSDYQFRTEFQQIMNLRDVDQNIHAVHRDYLMNKLFANRNVSPTTLLVYGASATKLHASLHNSDWSGRSDPGAKDSYEKTLVPKSNGQEVVNFTDPTALANEAYRVGSLLSKADSQNKVSDFFHNIN